MESQSNANGDTEECADGIVSSPLDLLGDIIAATSFSSYRWAGAGPLFTVTVVVHPPLVEPRRNGAQRDTAATREGTGELGETSRRTSRTTCLQVRHHGQSART
jgi:hypothetical protein